MKKLITLRLLDMSKKIAYALTIQILVMSSLIANESEAQIKSIDKVNIKFHVENASVLDVFSEIERLTDYNFVYTKSEAANHGGLSFNGNYSLYDVMVKIALQTDLSFKQINESIIVKKSPSSGFSKNTIVTTQGDFITIEGSVTDISGLPIPGVTVLEEGTSNGTVTNIDGSFQIEVELGAHLVFSFVGFETEKVRVASEADLEIILREESKSLDEVVVVGYGEVKRRDITGSVASIKDSDLKGQPITSFDQALQGRVPGVQITQASNAPGGGITIRVRGGNSISASNDPLYVIDGFPVSNPSPASGTSNSAIYTNPLATINPNDIESIEVLKDASATAIYGSRGANGVILVTTKRGVEGASRVDFESYVGVQEIVKQYDLVTAEQHTAAKNEQLTNLGFAERYGDPTGNYPNPPSTYGKGTDWQDEIFRIAPIQNYQVSISGGNLKTKYLVSASYFNQDGIVITSNYKRYTTRLNLDTELSKRVKIGTNFTLSRSINNSVNEVGTNGVVGLALRVSPASPVKDENGNWQLLNVGSGSGFSNIANPVAFAETSTNELVTDRVLVNTFTTINLTNDLVARISLGVDLFNTQRDIFYTPETLIANNVNGFGSNGYSNNLNLLNENTLNYTKSWGDNVFTAVFGVTFQNNQEKRTFIQAQNFPNYTLGAKNLGLANNPLPPRGSVQEWGLNSYLTRLNYVYRDRYLFTLTGRIDGSSRFGANNKYAFFPSGAFAWRLSDEEFLKSVETISDLKLRLSYGSTGNDGIGLYNSISAYSTGRTVFNDIEAITSEAIRIANPDLKWERTDQFNAGIDFSIVNNRFQLVMDYYIKTTKDLLLNIQLPSTTGFTSVTRNVGSVQNKGFELGLNTVNTIGEFKWNTNANISFNKNTVTKLGDSEEYVVGSGFNTLIVREGVALGSFYGNIFDGIWQSQEEIDAGGNIARTGDLPGALRFKDLNGDGVFNEGEDRTILGNGLPDYIYGITNTFNYKGFDLSIFFQGVVGNEVFNFTRRSLEQSDPSSALTKEVYENAWRPDAPSDKYSSLRQWRWPNTTSNFVEDGSFLRLKNLTIGYSWPVSSKLLKNARVYLSGQNLITFSDYSGFDPEVNSSFNSNTNYGVDAYSYPLSRTYLIGAKFQF